jgi:hypothetical protein
MRHNELRVGRFTSSEIYRLCGTDKVRATYIRKKQLERRLQKSLDTGAYSKAMAWGKFMEIVLFDYLEIDYEMKSKETFAHYRHGDIWSGSVDLVIPKVKIGEIKSFQYENFAEYTDCLMLQDIECLKTNFPKEYWQLVSNAIIHRVNRAEAISFMPYESQIPAIQELAFNYDGDDFEDYKYIAYAKPEDLPSLKDGGYYSNITTFEFEVPKADKIFLTKQVQDAGVKLLSAA